MPTEDLTLQEAADHLGVHYMTAYRYVKLGQLYAEKRGGSWVISPSDLAEFERCQNSNGDVAVTDTASLGTLEDALVAGDEVTAWRIIETSPAMKDDPIAVHLEMLAPALDSIGERWAQGDLTIAAEHKATAVASRIIGRLGTHLTSPGRRRGVVVIGAAPGDIHSIPTAMFADLIRSFGVDVIDLGGSPVADSFVAAARRYEGCVVVISLTGPGHEAAARETVETVRAALGDIPIAIGGGAVRTEGEALALGADLWRRHSLAAASVIAETAAARRHSGTA